MIIYKFKKLFDSCEKSLRAIARETGVSHVTLSRLSRARYVSDYNVSTDVLERLGKFFGIKKIDELIEFKK